MCVYVYIYIYMYRERERERDIGQASRPPRPGASRRAGWRPDYYYGYFY